MNRIVIYWASTMVLLTILLGACAPPPAVETSAPESIKQIESIFIEFPRRVIGIEGVLLSVPSGLFTVLYLKVIDIFLKYHSFFFRDSYY